MGNCCSEPKTAVPPKANAPTAKPGPSKAVQPAAPASSTPAPAPPSPKTGGTGPPAANDVPPPPEGVIANINLEDSGGTTPEFVRPSAISPREPENVKSDAKEHANQQMIKLLGFVRLHRGIGKARTFARWAPFQQKYEEYLFTDVLRTLEIREENDIMSDDDGASSFGATLTDISLDLDNLEEPPTEWLPDLINSLKKDVETRVLPPENEFVYLMKKVTDLFSPLESVVHIAVPEDGRLVIVGDLHGQLDDLLWILSEGTPSEKTHYLFNGDFVDRGPDQCEVLLLLYALKLMYPSSIWLNRGNHEEHRVNKAAGKDGFMQVCISRYSDQAYKAAQMSFKALPLCHIVNDKIAVLHGGLPEDKSVTLSEMRKINRHRECPTSKKKGKLLPASREDRIFQAMLWSDPRDMRERTAASTRGAGVWFNKDVTNDFLKVNGLSQLIRSHEVTSLGHKQLHDGKCTTIFSASRYCGKDDNRGAYFVLLPTLDMNTNEFFIRPGQVTKLRNQVDALVSPTKEEEIADAETIRKLAIQRLGELIFMRRSQLLGLFQQKDPDRRGSVKKGTWVAIMKSAVGDDLPWYSLSRHLLEVEEDGTISYIRFLERFQNKLATNWMKSWAGKWMEYGRSHITKCAVDLRKMLKKAEHKKESKLSYHEVCQALRKSIPGLSMTEIYYLLDLMDENNDGFLDADEWASQMEKHEGGKAIPGILDIWDLRRTNGRKFELLFKDMEKSAAGGAITKTLFSEKAMHACGGKEDSKGGWDLTAESLAQQSSKGGKIDLELTREMVNTLEEDRHRAKVIMDIIEVVTRAQVKLHDIFRLMDVNKDGGLSREEFCKGLLLCGMVESEEEAERREKEQMAGKVVNNEVISIKDAEQLWEQSDLDKDASVSWNEFFDALCIYDTWEELVDKRRSESQRADAVKLSQCE